MNSVISLGQGWQEDKGKVPETQPPGPADTGTKSELSVNDLPF